MMKENHEPLTSAGMILFTLCELQLKFSSSYTSAAPSINSLFEMSHFKITYFISP